MLLFTLGDCQLIGKSVEKVIEIFKDHKRTTDGRGRNTVVIALID